MKAAFFSLRDNAARRGKTFGLTFEQFKVFAVKTEYILKRGKSSGSYHIDRIDENGAYTMDNIQVLTNSENVKKYLKFNHSDEKNKPVFSVIVHKQPDNGDCPF